MFQLHAPSRLYRNWWLVVDAGEVDLCLKTPDTR